MASTYSTNLKIELIGTGEQSGTWGNTTNTNLGTLIEEAIAGYVTQAVTDGAATVLTIPNGTSSNGRNYVIQLTGALTANRTVEVPAVDKPYIFFNATTGGFSVTVKVSGQTGVTIANGKKAIVYTNSTDVIEVVNAPVSEAGTQTLSNKTLASPTVTGVATFAAGTAAAPAITTTGDTNTGIFFPAADTIAFTEGGAESMRIDSSGNVGIGTNSPDAKLRVNGTTKIGEGAASNTSKLMVNTVSGVAAGIQLFLDGNESWVINNPASSTALTFANSGTERMRIDSSGNVGIGTASPYSQLDVYSTIVSPTLGEATGVGSIRITNGASALSSAGGLEFKNAGDSNGYGSKIQALNSGGSQLVFANRNGSATWTERMRIDSSGNVGIGTSSPSFKFDVTGTARFTGLTQFDNSINLKAAILNYVYFDDALAFAKNGTGERMRIDSSGNLLVGTTTSSGKITSVLGTSGTAGYFETSGGTSAIYLKDTGANGANIALEGNGATTPKKYIRVQAGSLQVLNNAYSAALLLLDDSGNLTATGNVTAYSDARLKKNVSTIDNALALVEKMRGVRYERIDSGKAGVGVIAQEMQEVVPEVVHEGENLSVAYGNLVGVLIEAVKELSARVKELEAK